nr:MAG TPA: Sporulation initiation factor Spo0A C terminal [Caudoviricetes sp.]
MDLDNVRRVCNNCGQENNYDFTCPICGSSEFKFVAGWPTETRLDNLMNRHITEEAYLNGCLEQFGIPQNLAGYTYLIAGLLLCVEDPRLTDHMTGKLYPAVAELLDKTAIQVERGMRYAIESGWNRGDSTNRFDLLENPLFKGGHKPSNSEFMCSILNRLKRHLRTGENSCMG